MKSAVNVLKKHQLKNTKLRVAVLKAFKQANQGLNHQELTKLIDIDFDRVSLFRTLSQFEESGIIHKILDLNGVANYALNALDGSAEDDSQKCLVHFICLECAKITCIDHDFEEKLSPPSDLNIQEIEVTYKGICKQCKSDQ